MFWENFLELCKTKGRSPNAVAKELGIASGTVTSWKRGSEPQPINLKKIADYFGVTIEDLISNKPSYSTFISYSSEEKPKINLQEVERIWQENGNSSQEPDCSFDSTQKTSNPNTTELDEYEKKLIGTFRETTIDGKLRILNAADEIKKDIEKNHNGEDSSFA